MDALKTPITDVSIIDINEPGGDYAICAKAVIDVFIEPVTCSFTLDVRPGKEASASGKFGKNGFKTYGDLKLYVSEESFAFTRKHIQEIIQERKHEKMEYEAQLIALGEMALQKGE